MISGRNKVHDLKSSELIQAWVYLCLVAQYYPSISDVAFTFVFPSFASAYPHLSWNNCQELQNILFLCLFKHPRQQAGKVVFVSDRVMSAPGPRKHQVLVYTVLGNRLASLGMVYLSKKIYIQKSLSISSKIGKK